MQKIRFGVVGTNFITDWVIEGGREDPRFEITAVYSRSEETARAFAAKHRISHTFVSLEQMAASPFVDAVYIASPNALHAAQSILCMQQGKHVLCEKAFASNAREVKCMIETARRRRIVLMEAMKPTLTPGFRAIRAALPLIGPLRRYFSSYCQYSSRYDRLKDGHVLNAFNPELSNGASMDIGIYTIYPMVALFGRPLTIQAAGIKLASGTDGQAAVNFTFANGLLATVLYGKIADSSLPTEIQGEQGTIRADRINLIGRVSLIHRKGEVEETLYVQTDRHEYYHEIAEFIDIICSGRSESSINSHTNSLIAIEILDEIRRQLAVRFPADENQ
jgi:predicted dehydrogenase